MQIRRNVGLFLVAFSVGLLCGRVRAGIDQGAHIRCAVRLGLTLTGQTPDPALLAAMDPQGSASALMETAAFHDRFARFINSELNDEPSLLPRGDATYYLARYVLENKLPWRELDGAYDVAIPDGMNSESEPVVTPSVGGLGYFRAKAWLLRYRGNEPSGLKLVTAYRMMHNIIGLELVAATNAEGADISATGRMAPACAGCHYQGPFALDTIAKVLTRWQNGAFRPPTAGPQIAFDGVTIADDHDVVEALLASENYKFNTCRLAFRFLYGRAETSCEAQLFDACLTAFAASGTIQAALLSLLTDQSFCA